MNMWSWHVTALDRRAVVWVSTSTDTTPAGLLSVLDTTTDRPGRRIHADGRVEPFGAAGLTVYDDHGGPMPLPRARELTPEYADLVDNLTAGAAGVTHQYVTADGDPLLDYAAIAERLGLAVETVRRYRVKPKEKGGLPDPDERVGHTDLWRTSTIDSWKRNRPGRGVGGGRPPKNRPSNP